MKKTIYFKLQYYKNNDKSLKKNERLFDRLITKIFKKIKMLKYIFHNIKTIENDDSIEYTCYTMSNQEVKALKRIENILNKNINLNVVLSKRIKEIVSNIKEPELQENIKSVSEIISHSEKSKKIYLDFCKMIMKSVIERRKQNSEEQSLSILIDSKDYNNTQLINELISQYKMINIVTNNRKQFEGLEEEAEKNFESISVLNNKRKSLSNAKYILNVDFSGDEILEYCIDRTAIIFNIANTKIDKLMNFDGTIINNVKLIDNSEFSLQDRYLVNNEKWKEMVRKKIEKNEYDLIGNRGKVEIK